MSDLEPDPDPDAGGIELSLNLDVGGPGEGLTALEAGVATVTHRFMLRPGMVAEIVLPADLTQREAKRLGKFLEAAVL